MRFNLKKITFGIAVVFSLFTIFFLFKTFTNHRSVHRFDTFTEIDGSEAEDIVENNENEEIIEEEVVVVDIKGEVKETGIYEMDENDRVFDVVEKAGGFTENAAKEFVNLAEKVYDSMVIHIPNEKEVADLDLLEIYDVGQSKNETGKNETIQKVNINNASIEELQSLPGIGPKKAESIVQYRQENGMFTSTDELMEITGIGEKIYASIEDYITVQ